MEFGNLVEALQAVATVPSVGLSDAGEKRPDFYQGLAG
jgi:hypothetical protein